MISATISRQGGAAALGFQLSRKETSGMLIAFLIGRWWLSWWRMGVVMVVVGGAVVVVMVLEERACFCGWYRFLASYFD